MIRVATFTLEEVIPFIFTPNKRHELRAQGYKYTDWQWINASKRLYPIVTVYKDVYKYDYKILRHVTVAMGSHRYQTFVLKGTKCAKCGVEGKFFALECHTANNSEKFHFNLYGIDKHGEEIMITKDHIIPRSKGGKNVLSNYQPLCIKCNQQKANHVNS